MDVRCSSALRAAVFGPALLGVVLLGLAGCHRRGPAPAILAMPHYTVGAPWQGDDGTWFYPREQFDYRATGLATITTAPAGGLTADGERYDPQALAGAHQTLQLPAIVQVRNLENGRTLLVRLNDRGPASQGRLIALTPRAAALLAMQPGQPARVAVTLDAGLSQQAAGGTGGGPHLDIAAAPVGGVQEQALGAPGTSPAGNSFPLVPGAAPGAGGDAAGLQAVQLPMQASQGYADPGALWVDAGRFGGASYADQIARRIGGSVSREGRGREILYSVRLGPFQAVPDADAALDQVLRAGVTGARIIVE